MTKTDKTKDLALVEFTKSLSHRVPEKFLCRHVHNYDLSAINREHLKVMVKDLSSLREKGTISEEEFAELITYVCSLFVENEVQERFRKVFGSHLEKILVGAIF